MTRERTYIVYKHTCKATNKVYIGITSWNLEARWRNKYKTCPHMARAVKKYGWDGFDHEILAEGLSKEDAQVMEKELISLYKSNHPDYGYNISTGGESHTGCHFHHTPEAKLKISRGNKGKTVSDETKQKMHDAKILSGLDNSKYCNSEEAISKRKESMKGNTYYKNRKANVGGRNSITIYQLENNNIIATFSSIKEAERLTGIKHISECINGKRLTAGGYTWKK